MKRKSILLAIWLSMAASSFAQFAPDRPAANVKDAVVPKPAIEVKLVQKKVVSEANGVERLVDAETARPGDVIEYQATYTNKGDKPVNQVIANLPLPDGLEYVPKSAKPASGVKMSTQDKQFGEEPLSRKSADGRSEVVPYNEYRDIRWTIGQISAGKSVNVTARAKVEAVVPKGIQTKAGADAKAAAATKP